MKVAADADKLRREGADVVDFSAGEPDFDTPDNIKRAVRRGTGEEEGVSYEEITYEAYGPGGVAIMIETLTDNKNRTAGEVRAAFTKAAGLTLDLTERGLGVRMRRFSMLVVDGVVKTMNLEEATGTEESGAEKMSRWMLAKVTVRLGVGPVRELSFSSQATPVRAATPRTRESSTGWPSTSAWSSSLSRSSPGSDFRRTTSASVISEVSISTASSARLSGECSREESMASRRCSEASV